ncbi:MAG: ester cyclase [Chloroflexi bacterium]|nr:ester cyclase [Chloroflexota bacterium]NTW01685.1 ester cyclase [Oscillochloris sp.]
MIAPTVVSSIETNKALVRRYWFELWNDKKDIIAEIAVDPVTLHFAPGQAHQPPSLRKWFETALIAFPDVHFTLHQEIAENELVVSRWSYIATNTGEFLGRPPTNRRVTDSGIDIFRLADGKIVEMWILQDSLGLLRQLGWLPA